MKFLLNVGAEILVQPSSKVVPVGVNATFFCSAQLIQGNNGVRATWFINGNIQNTYSSNSNFDFKESVSNVFHNLSLTVLASAENNKTVIRCKITSPEIVSSNEATLKIFSGMYECKTYV